MKILKWLAAIVATLIVLLAIAILAVLWRGRSLAEAHQNRPVLAMQVPTDSARVARGEHLATVVCAACHGSHGELPLAGSSENILAVPNGPDFGRLNPPNLTPGGRLAVYASDGELARAIREGVNHEGRAMLVMPSQDFHGLSRPDLEALIAYLRSQPAVTNPIPPRELHPAAYMVLGLGLFPTSLQPAIAQDPEAVPEDSTAAYGGYLTQMLGCRTCHGATLHGGVKGQFPPIGPDLVSVTHQQPQWIFDRALRGGIGHDGHPLDPTRMPWSVFRNLTRVEMAAIYQNLKSLP